MHVQIDQSTFEKLMNFGLALGQTNLSEIIEGMFEHNEICHEILNELEKNLGTEVFMKALGEYRSYHEPAENLALEVDKDNNVRSIRVIRSEP